MSDLVRIPNPAAGDDDASPVHEDRNAEIYRLHAVNRLTNQAIADRFSISNQRVSQILQRVKRDMPAVDTAELRRQSLELHYDIQRRVLELAEMQASPVFVGKDGAIGRDENNNVVRDHSLKLRALELALKVDGEIRKLHGLDAATKTSIDQTSMVRYEISGWNDKTKTYEPMDMGGLT